MHLSVQIRAFPTYFDKQALYSKKQTSREIIRIKNEIRARRYKRRVAAVSNNPRKADKIWAYTRLASLHASIIVSNQSELSFFVTVTSAVSWEEWWTYDGISGEFGYIQLVILQLKLLMLVTNKNCMQVARHCNKLKKHIETSELIFTILSSTYYLLRYLLN